MKERGIIFSAPMVRAILDGSKTQTRRVVKPQPAPHHGIQAMFGTSPDGFAFGTPGVWREVGADYPDGPEDDRRCPYGVVGERLWVRETFSAPPGGERRDECIYRADVTPEQERETRQLARSHPALVGQGRWTPAIHMPRWASRVTLEITGVRVQLLQELSEEDAKAEGVTTGPQQGKVNGEPATLYPMTHRMAFTWLWNVINGERPGCSWQSNPWVWCVSFRRIEP
jgi:hypothetical protein